MGFDVGGVVLSSPGNALSVDSGTQWMAVNANGILTRPQTPFFRGQITGQSTPYNAGGGALLVIADVNFGGCWNNATGLFTCPIAGSYMVIGASIAQTQAGYFYIQKNGVTQHFTHWNVGSTWHWVSLSDIVQCAAGDTIRYTVGGLTPATTGIYAGGGHDMFSIALLA